jgi:hypothetical protein
MKSAFLQIFTAVGLLIIPLSARGQADAPCDSIKTFADDKRPIREIFVSPSGNNSAGDGSQTNPYQTINRAAQAVQPGDAIRLLPGEHAAGSSIRGLAGTTDAPIWLGGVPGQARPVIQGGSVGIQLSKVRFLVVENIEIRGARGNGINCDDGGELRQFQCHPPSCFSQPRHSRHWHRPQQRRHQALRH